MKILILGSSGFLGSYCKYFFDNAGNQVTSLSRGSEPSVQIEDFEAQIALGGFDLVLNGVALATHEKCESNPYEARKVNAIYPESWAHAALLADCKFVHISTDAVFDGASSETYRELDETNPTSQYGLSKREGELRVLEANPSALVIRTNFFGWSRNGDKGILDFFVNSFTSRTLILGFDDYIVSSIYMGDLLDSIVFLVKGGDSGIYHVTSSTPLSKYEFGELVGKALDLSTVCMKRASINEAHDLVERGRNLSLSNTKLEKRTGVSQPSSSEGIVRAATERASIIRYFGSGS
jgi:dTDP-4-dehydrorhamnose reductase